MPSTKKILIPSLLLILLGGYGIFAAVSPGSTFDFGDAPDSYNSILDSNGPRTKNTETVWLGAKVDKEENSRQTDEDLGDDGIILNMTACKQSEAQFVIHIQDPGNLKGTAYINLFADWNKNGSFKDKDTCADEWAIRNAEIDLSQQTSEIFIYNIPFQAGTNVKDIWYRGTITKDEMLSESSTGKFKIGEIEDYGPLLPEPEDNEEKMQALCDPWPLVVDHGESEILKIRPFPGTAAILSVQANSQNDDLREMTVGGWINDYYPITYTSKMKDGPDRVTEDYPQFLAEYLDKDGNHIFQVLNCQVYINHTEEKVIIENPPKKKPGEDAVPKEKTVKTKDITIADGEFEKFITDDITSFSIGIIPNNLGGEKATCIEILLKDKNYSLPKPTNSSINLNLQGWHKSDWQCRQYGDTYSCYGSQTLTEGQKSVVALDFASPIDPPNEITARLLDNSGKVITTVSVNYQK